MLSSVCSLGSSLIAFFSCVISVGGKEELIQELACLLVNLRSGSTVEEVQCQEAYLEARGWRD